MIDAIIDTSYEYKGYKGSGEYSVEDDVYYGKILGIPSLVTYESDEFADLEKQFQDAVDDYLETMAFLAGED